MPRISLALFLLTILPWKERVLGVINEDGVAEAFRIPSMPQTGIGIRNSDIVNTKILVAGSKGSNFMVAFEREMVDGTRLDFSVVDEKTAGHLGGSGRQ